MIMEISAGRTRAYFIAFMLGAVAVGGFDFLYTQAGGQSYSALWVPPPLDGWPWYVPIQMGLAGVGALYLWQKILPKLAQYFCMERANYATSVGVTFPMAMLLLCLGMSFLFLGSALHGSVFVMFLLTSFAFLVFFGNKLEQASFLIVGIGGGLAEWVLLSPQVNYWQFHHQELFSRLPMWEPSVYGWIGVTVHRLASQAAVGRAGLDPNIKPHA